MADVLFPSPTRKQEQSKVPPIVERPSMDVIPKDPPQNPDKKGAVPFKFGKDGSILVSQEFLMDNRDTIKAEATKAGYDTPAEYLQAVVKGVAGKAGKWSGKSVSAAGKMKWTPEQESKATVIAQKHGMSPQEFKAIIEHESAGTMSPQVVNSIGATGIIQFMPTTSASYLLMEQRAAAIEAAKTPEEKAKAAKDNPLFWQLSPANQKKAAAWGQKTMANLPLERQLDLADLYITDRARGKKGFENVYSAIFAGNPEIKEFKKGTEAYSNNKALDKNGDGTITRKEWTQPVENKIKSVPTAEKTQSQAQSRGKPVGPAPISQEETQQVVDRATKVLRLAMPTTPRQDIETAATVVPTKISVPGEREQAILAEDGGVGGLYWPQNSKEGEQIWVTGSLPKPAATGVMAHEIGHAMGLEDIGKGQPAPEQPGLMHWSGEEAGFTNNWSDVIRAAAKTGGDVLDAEQAGKVEDLYSGVPDFLKGPLQYLVDVRPSRPSDAFNQDLMEESSGPSPIGQDVWDSEKRK